LLGELLNVHPDVFVFPETHWIPKMHEFFGTGLGPVAELVEIVLGTRHVTGDLVVQTHEQAIRRRFRAGGEMSVAGFCDHLAGMFTARDGKRYWADKTPDYGGYLGILQLHWPSTRFIHLIRDGVSVALSMSRHPGYQWLASAMETSWVPASYNGYYRSVPSRDVGLDAYARLWERRLRRIRNEASRLTMGSVLEVRFEDLLAQPGPTLRGICAFTGLPADTAWETASAARIDRTRATSPRASDLLQSMGAGPLALLRELGYLPDEPSP
jgi:hypothetical protein